MAKLGTPENPLRVAIIGSGPAGFYGVQDFFAHKELAVRIDMFDRLPAPFGLVRNGVAPDHQKIKAVQKLYDRLAQREEFRFFGNVDFGRDLSRADLEQRYHQILIACGSQGDRTLGIPGEELEGVHSAREFVAWYNAHPDHVDDKFNLAASGAVVVGVGNVAADVARILCRSPEELGTTDIADYALEALGAGSVRNVHVLGRRGPVQAAFSPPEIKELGELEEAEASTLPEEMALDEYSQAELEAAENKEVQRKVDNLLALSGRSEPEKPKKLSVRFLVSPVEILGDDQGRVKAVTIVKNKLVKRDDGHVGPQATDQFETIEAGLIFRSVGYYGVPLDGIPFDERGGVIPNEHGRVFDGDSPALGLYVTGWIKRGPSGLIGTNKGCAKDTVACMIEDLEAASVLSPSDPGLESIENLLRDRNVTFVTYDDWLKLDAIERERGEAQGRPRVKFTRREDFLAALAG